MERVKAKACDPIESLEEIERLREHFMENPRNGMRDALLITLGCNLGLRVSDLCELKVSDLKGKEYLDIVEKKTKKRRIIKLNEKVIEAVNEYIEIRMLAETRYLFGSQKGGHLKTCHIHKMIKKAAREVGISGNIGSHSLRKTMAYHVYRNNMDNPEILFDIMTMFNHTSLETTKRYLKNSSNKDKLYTSINL